MERLFRIFRFDPQQEASPRFQEYLVRVEPIDKILDCLNRIRWEQDPSLSFRMSCAHGICGSDGMRINGVCTLACQRLTKNYPDDPITIEPLPNLRVVKDLVVDIEPFFEKYRSLKPYLVAETPAEGKLSAARARKSGKHLMRPSGVSCAPAALQPARYRLRTNSSWGRPRCSGPSATCLIHGMRMPVSACACLILMTLSGDARATASVPRCVRRKLM